MDRRFTLAFWLTPLRLPYLKMHIFCCRCDVALQGDLQPVLLGAACRGLDGLLHAGGVLLDAALQKQSLGHLRVVLAPKTQGMVNLRQVGAAPAAALDPPTAAAAGAPLHSRCLVLCGSVSLQGLGAHPLARSLLFSSIAALTGPAGSSNYAAANAALDAAAAALQASGLCATSMQWGAWSEVGMVAGSHAVQRAMGRAGIGMVTPASGLDALGAVLRAAAPAAQLAAIPFAWGRFMQLPHNAAAGLYQEFTSLDGARHTAPAAPQAASAPPPAPRAALPSPEEVLRRVGAAVVAVHGAELGAGVPLVQAGLDSLGECCSVVFLGNPAYACLKLAGLLTPAAPAPCCRRRGGAPQRAGRRLRPRPPRHPGLRLPHRRRRGRVYSAAARGRRRQRRPREPRGRGGVPGAAPRPAAGGGGLGAVRRRGGGGGSHRAPAGRARALPGACHGAAGGHVRGGALRAVGRRRHHARGGPPPGLAVRPLPVGGGAV